MHPRQLGSSRQMHPRQLGSLRQMHPRQLVGHSSAAGRPLFGRRSTSLPLLRAQPPMPPGWVGKGAGAVATGGGGGDRHRGMRQVLGFSVLGASRTVCKGEKLGQYYLTAHGPLTRPSLPRKKKTAHTPR